MLAGRWNRLPAACRHRFRECASHDSGDAGPISRAEADRMHLDFDVGCIDEHRAQILDVLRDALCLVAVGPGDDDVLRVALSEPVPFLITEDVEVEGVEDFEILLHGRRLLLVRGRRCRAVPLGKGERGGCQSREKTETDTRYDSAVHASPPHGYQYIGGRNCYGSERIVPRA